MPVLRPAHKKNLAYLSQISHLATVGDTISAWCLCVCLSVCEREFVGMYVYVFMCLWVCVCVIHIFFYRQLDFPSEPGVANEILENEP